VRTPFLTQLPKSLTFCKDRQDRYKNASIHTLSNSSLASSLCVNPGSVLSMESLDALNKENEDAEPSFSLGGHGLKRFLSESNPDDSVAVDDIISAAHGLSASPQGEPPRKTRKISQRGRARAGLESRDSVASFRSVRSFASAISAYSPSSRINKTSRKGRRRWSSRWSTSAALALWLQSADGPWSMWNLRLCRFRSPSRHPKFICQFCDKTFSKRYDWNRHETSIHVFLESWICDDASCQPKDEHDRTFYRKDHFMQHLENAHGLSDPGSRQTTSSRCRRAAEPLPSNHPALMCRICGLRFPSWEERVDHVAGCRVKASPVASDDWEAEALGLDSTMSSTGDVDSTSEWLEST
jgi:hypothetical protein